MRAVFSFLATASTVVTLPGAIMVKIDDAGAVFWGGAVLITIGSLGTLLFTAAYFVTVLFTGPPTNEHE